MTPENERYLQQYTDLLHDAEDQNLALPRPIQTRCLNAALTLRKMLTVSPNSMSCEQLRMVGDCREEFTDTYNKLKNDITHRFAAPTKQCAYEL